MIHGLVQPKTAGIILAGITLLALILAFLDGKGEDRE